MPLKNTNFKNLLNMLFYKDILRILVKIDLRLLRFFYDNTIILLDIFFYLDYMFFLVAVVINARYLIR